MNIGQMTAWIDGDDLARECEEEKKRQEKRRVSHDVSVCHSLVSTVSTVSTGVTVWCPLHKKPKKLGEEMFSGRRMFYTVTQATPGHL